MCAEETEARDFSRACLFVVESSYYYPICLGEEGADIGGWFALARVGQYQAGRNDNGSLWPVAHTGIRIPTIGTGARDARCSEAARSDSEGADRSEHVPCSPQRVSRLAG